MDKIKGCLNHKKSIIFIVVVAVLLLMNTYSLSSVSFNMTAGSIGEDGLQTYTPHLSYPKGEYRITASGSGNVLVHTAEGNVLGSGAAGEEFTITLDKDESDIIVCSDTVQGIYHIKVQKDGGLYKDVIFLTFFVVAVFGYVLYKKNTKQQLEEKELVALVLFGVVILASYPLFTGSVLFGHDVNFHLYRMEGIKDGLLSGQFPVRIHPTHNNGYGYITSSVYPELFLYFPAVLRILGMSPVMAYNTFLMGVNALTAICMYYAAKGFSKSAYVGLMASMVYTLSTWRVINLYYRAAIGEALSMVFFPLLFYGLYCLLKGEHKRWWVLTLACSGIFMSHIISTVFAAVTIVVFILVCFPDFMQKDRFLGFVKAGVTTLLLNAWYLAGFLTYYLGLDMAIKHVPENTEFYQNAIFPAQLFNIFNEKFGYSYLLDMGMQYDMSLTLGVGVTVCLVIGLGYYLFGKRTQEQNRFLFGLFMYGVVLVVMSTTLFPWQLFQQSALINKFCGVARLPWRFLSLASPAIVLTASVHMKEIFQGDSMKKLSFAVAAFICAMAFVVWGTAYTTQNGAVFRKGQAAPTSASAGWDNEYFLYGTDTGMLDANRYITSDEVSLSDHEKSGSNITLTLEGAKEGSWIEVPLLYYPGYKAVDDLGNRLLTSDGDNHVLRIMLREGSGEVHISYSGFWYFRAAEAVSLLTACGFVTMYIKTKRKRERNV